LEGLRIALEFLDEVIRIIRQAESAEAAKTQLMGRFGLSELQAQAILDMQLRRLAALERQKIEDEYREVMKTIAYLEDLLAHPEKILALVKEDMQALADKFGDERRTKIMADERESFEDEELIPDKAVLISLTQKGYIKQTPVEQYKAQGRGGRGVSGMATKEADEVIFLESARTHDTVLFFSDKGKVYAIKGYQIPEAARDAKGVYLSNLISILPNERISALLPISKGLMAAAKAERAGEDENEEETDDGSLETADATDIDDKGEGVEAGDEARDGG
jgi:DNA gyrase subunit A